MNLELLAEATDESCTMVVLNGAMDKLRTGYYPSFFYPRCSSHRRRLPTSRSPLAPALAGRSPRRALRPEPELTPPPPPPLAARSLAECVQRFFTRFDSVFYLRPLSGAGWLYRVYPEPWQVAPASTSISRGSARLCTMCATACPAARPAVTASMPVPILGRACNSHLSRAVKRPHCRREPTCPPALARSLRDRRRRI